MSKGWHAAGGSVKDWRRIRAQVLCDNQATNEGRCTLAIPGVCTTLATEVHHVLGRQVTGDDPSYLAAWCRACNLKVGQPKLSTPPPRQITKW
jgi:5-methylcytosine-specific restriction endonuclease McrA